MLGRAEAGPEGRVGLYDVAPTSIPHQYAYAGFRTVADGASPGRCRDVAIVGLATSKAGNQLDSVGFDMPAIAGAAEDFYTLLPLKRDEYLVAGQSGNPNSGPAEGIAYRVRIADKLTVLATLHEGLRGGDPAHEISRFRVAAMARDGSHFWLAGSRSRRDRPNAAMRRFASADFGKVDELVSADNEAADYYGVATSTNGTVLLVGWAPENNTDRRVAWLEFVGKQAAASIGAPSASTGRAFADAKLPVLVQALARSGAGYQLPKLASNALLRYYLPALPAGLPLDIAVSLEEATGLRVRLLARSGEVDLMLSDSQGGLRDFSNNTGAGAPQVLISNLAAGSYVLTLLPEADAKDLEIDVGRLSDGDLADVSKLSASLGPAKRVSLVDILPVAGLTAPPEPTIGIGGETARAMIAAQDEGLAMASLNAKLPRAWLFDAR